MKVISKNNPTITFDRVEIFANLEKKQRSGHLGHAMVECADGSILAFYSNCSGTHGHTPKTGGHTMYGWVEYKRSEDKGLTWNEPSILEYSYEAFIDGTYKIGCEKAVVCDDGTIILFCLRSIGEYFEPYATPVCLISHDNGVSWSQPIEVHNERGRIYDAVYRDGIIYVLEFCYSTDAGFTCAEENQYYKIIISDDNGKTFRVLSQLPFNTLGHAYGNMIFRQDGSLLFCAYTDKDEYNLTCLISNDNGKTWGEPFKSYVAKIARNPQLGYINGYYILHARSEKGVNFVIYYSKDGINWDEGTIVSELLDGRPRGGCYYSNNLPITGADGVKRLLIQYSEQYAHETSRVNVMHAWIECKN